MKDGKCAQVRPAGGTRQEDNPAVQKILVFQQKDSGESKIKGIREYGEGLFQIETFCIDEPLPPILDDTAKYLPDEIEADLVLDFLQHPDLSHDLAVRCRDREIPIVASGKKLRVGGAYTPPT